VWKADDEAQAIKVRTSEPLGASSGRHAVQRVHRIGQTKPISGKLRSLFRPTRTKLISNTVKTLAIQSTAEEAIMARRAELKGKTEGRQAASFTDDLNLRHFIAVSVVLDFVDVGYVLILCYSIQSF